MAHLHCHPGQHMLSSRFLASIGGYQHRLVLLILNFRLPPVTFALWNHAQLRIVADGGANQLYDSLSQWPCRNGAKVALTDFVPDIIEGDLDSIRPDVRDFYSRLGTRIVDRSEDQDSTDLQKCLACASAEIAADPDRLRGASIFAAGALGGRLDHVLSNLNTLYSQGAHKLVLCGDGNLVRLLPCGRSALAPDRALEGPACGLVALGAPATASSSGLKWNLDNTRLELGGMQSTSNVMVSDDIVVETDQPLIWTTQFQDPLQADMAPCVA